jgi:diguanylate cyclase (GGDEF)-like protein/PAS domain S-box-containing protein
MGLREFELTFHRESGFGELEADVHNRTNRQFMLVRTLGVLFLGLMALVLPLGIGLGTRLVLAGLLWFVVIPLGLTVARRLPTQQVDLFHTINDLAVTCLAVTVAPQIWGAGMVIMTGVVVASIPIQPRRTIVAVTVPAAALMGVAAHLNGVAHWYAVLLAQAATIPTFDTYYRSSRRRDDAIRTRYDALIDAAAVFFWELDLRTGRFESVAGNVRPLVGYTANELLGMNWTDIVTRDDRQRLEALPRMAEGAERAVVAKLRHRDGRHLAFRHVVRRVEGTTVLRGVSSDINDLAEATETIRFQAEHDALTGIHNRSVLVERLEQAVRAATADHPVALLMVDLDRFKEVNDTLGHPIGDRLLQILAQRFVDVLPETALVARLGGDEFAVLLTAGVTPAVAMDTARILAAQTEHKFEIDRVKLSVSPSIGVVLAPDHGTTTDEMLRHADAAMYEAKRRGEFVRMFESSPGDLTLERLTLSATISAALDEGQFELWFQPKVSLETGVVLGAEGLARWRHPERGVLPPSEFLELVSLAGEYHRFTDMVVARGMAAAATWAEDGHDLEISVNLSSLSFFDQRLPERLADQLARHGIRPDRFTLELTEADILEDAGLHASVFERLHRLGVGISIDDFGTGYSSLVRLRQLPVTEIKLDRSFVSKLATDPEDRIIVRTVVDLAVALGQGTVAEGVEDEETAAMLRSIGCQVAQGYLYAKPMPLEEFSTFLDTWDPALAPLGQRLPGLVPSRSSA